MIDEYDQIRHSFRSPFFRRQCLVNLVNHQPWHTGFDGLLCSLPYERSIGDSYFCHDARACFRYEDEAMDEATDMPAEEFEGLSNDELYEAAGTAGTSCQLLVYRLVKNYVRRKLKSKHELEWKPEWTPLTKTKEGQEALKKRKDYSDYMDKKAKIAKTAFLEVRSTTEPLDFINYFAGTLCSVPQFLKPADFLTLTQALYAETDKVRTWTLLALSANA
jgi:CRISPR-associated protein Cmx8